MLHYLLPSHVRLISPFSEVCISLYRNNSLYHFDQQGSYIVRQKIEAHACLQSLYSKLSLEDAHVSFMGTHYSFQMTQTPVRNEFAFVYTGKVEVKVGSRLTGQQMQYESQKTWKAIFRIIVKLTETQVEKRRFRCRSPAFSRLLLTLIVMNEDVLKAVCNMFDRVIADQGPCYNKLHYT